MHKLLKKLLYVSFIYLFLQMNVYAVQEFVIEDIRVEGLQRITPGTVFNYLPMKVGDTYDDQLSAEAVRALFKTGFFKDVRLERDGGILVIILEERPSIASITLSGNEDIRSEDLIDSLRQIGFAEGRAFDRLQLEKLEQELRRQYLCCLSISIVIFKLGWACTYLTHCIQSSIRSPFAEIIKSPAIRPALSAGNPECTSPTMANS